MRELRFTAYYRTAQFAPIIEKTIYAVSVDAAVEKFVASMYGGEYDLVRIVCETSL